MNKLLETKLLNIKKIPIKNLKVKSDYAHYIHDKLIKLDIKIFYSSVNENFYIIENNIKKTIDTNLLLSYLTHSSNSEFDNEIFLNQFTRICHYFTKAHIDKDKIKNELKSKKDRINDIFENC